MFLLFTFQFIVYCVPLYFYPRLSLAPKTALLSWLKEMVIVKWVTPRTQISRHVTRGGESCLCLWHCANNPGEPLLATLLVYHLTTFQFVIRIYHHTEGYRLLPFHVLKRPDSLSQLIRFLSFRLSCPSFSILYNFLPPLIFNLPLYSFYSYLSYLKISFFYKFPVQYLSVVCSTNFIFLGMTCAGYTWVVLFFITQYSAATR
jgi:hypothetical protein